MRPSVIPHQRRMDASCEPLQKLLSRSPLFRRLSGSATTVIRIIMPTRDYTIQVGDTFGTTVRLTRKFAKTVRHLQVVE